MLLAFKQNAFCGPNCFEESVRIISEIGFEGIGLVFDKPWLWLADLEPSRMNEIIKILQRAHLTVASVSACNASGYLRSDNDFTPPGQRFGPSFTSPHIQDRKLRIEHTKQVIDFAVELGCLNVDTSTGYQQKEMDFVTAWHYAKDCLKELAEYADKKGVSLNIEYEPGEFGPGGLLIGDAHTFLAMASDVNAQNFRATWDVIHSWVASEDLAATAELLLDAGRLAVVEFDDGVYKIDPETKREKRRHFHLIPGTGEIASEYPSILNTLVQNHFSGPIIVELYSLWDRDPKSACQKTYKYLMGKFEEYFK